MDDGRVIEMKPGDVFYVSLHLLGAEKYAH
jgi:hypothetical protein